MTMTALNHDLVALLRAAAREARERDVVRACARYMRGEATDKDRVKIATACWPLLGKDVRP